MIEDILAKSTCSCEQRFDIDALFILACVLDSCTVAMSHTRCRIIFDSVRKIAECCKEIWPTLKGAMCNLMPGMYLVGGVLVQEFTTDYLILINIHIRIEVKMFFCDLQNSKIDKHGHNLVPNLFVDMFALKVTGSNRHCSVIPIAIKKVLC